MWRSMAARLTGSGSTPLLGLAAMYFLVVCAVGILRPIKNALALDGLGATDFYKVYLVSAGVVLFVPLYNRVAERFSFRWLVPGIAAFFAVNLVLFRLSYIPESATFGLLFYGWYDLFAAALVTQFFIATQLFLDTRAAKRAYPMIIAGGSLGATLGGAITGFFAGALGTPNLLLVAAALIVVFCVGMPLVLSGGLAPSGEREPPRRAPEPELSAGDLRSVFGNRHVQLIAATVLITILVKQLLDYQFNVVTKEVFESRDAISAFQGKFNAATQWLPMLALAMLRPALRRWGVGAAVVVLPLAMLGASAGLIVFGGLWAVAAAKGAETAFRYSTERTGREILYVPVPEEIKLKAKAYIDVAIEKGAGKVMSALMILVLLQVVGYGAISYAVAVLSVIWLVFAVWVHREYIRTLAVSIEGRFASLRGGFASLLDASTLPAVRRALTGGSTLQTAFALDLIDQSAPADASALAAEVNRLTDHPVQEIRQRALTLLARFPAAADESRLRARLSDPVPAVREAAVRALAACRGGDGGLVRELIGSEDAAVRTATLACLGRREIRVPNGVVPGQWYLARRAGTEPADVAERMEIALALGAVRDDADPEQYIEPLLDDPDPRVRSAALRSAGVLVYVPAYQRMIAALASPQTREAAREALIRQGGLVVTYLSAFLHDEAVDPRIRRSIPSVLSAIVQQGSIDTLFESIMSPRTDQLLDHRALKALSKLRVAGPRLEFPEQRVLEVALRHDEEADFYASSLVALQAAGGGRRTAGLLQRALREASDERRDGLFRCLGLLHDPEATYRAYLATTRGSPAVRANALEWLERTIGHDLFTRLASLIEFGGLPEPSHPRHLRETLDRLSRDGDAWVACCAAALAAELYPPVPTEARQPAIGGPRVQAIKLYREPPRDSEATVHLVEKVFMLQEVDLLREVASGDLALLASITQQIEVPGGTVLVRRGEPPSALFVIHRGSVELHGAGDPIVLGPGGAVGTWALIDDSPSQVDAVAAGPVHLLQVTREEFRDLLADNPELAIGLLQGLARRMRALVAA
jgi:ATP:ADP antiporter, AAA family